MRGVEVDLAGNENRARQYAHRPPGALGAPRLSGGGSTTW
jgi:hypothetical protein